MATRRSAGGAIRGEERSGNAREVVRGETARATAIIREGNGMAAPYGVDEDLEVAAEDPGSSVRDTRFKAGNQAAKNRQLRLVKLDTPTKVRRTLWEVVRDLRKGAIRADTGNATVNALRLLLKLYEVDEQNAAIEEARAAVRSLRERIETLMAQRRGLEK